MVVVIQLVVQELVLLPVLSSGTNCHINPELKNPSSRHTIDNQNRANLAIHVWRTGPCGYRTLISQTPSDDLPALPLCKWHNLTVSMRHSSPLAIASVFKTAVKKVLKRNGLQLLPYALQNMTSTGDKSGEKCLQNARLKHILAQTGGCCSSMHVRNQLSHRPTFARTIQRWNSWSQNNT